MENETCCGSVGNTTTYSIKFSPVLQAVGFVILFWVMLSHGVIIACFIVNRRKPWTNYAKQIFSLSSDDFILGVACLILLFGFTSGVLMNFIFCSFMFYFFFCAQCASLYHVLGICIYRAMTLLKTPYCTDPVSLRTSILLIVCSWMAAICICALPFILWSEPHNEMPSCQIDFLFGTNMKQAMALIAIGYLVPMVFTNIIYFATCCKLMSMWKKIFPTTAKSTNTSTENTIENGHRSNNRSGIKAHRVAIGTIGILLLLFNIFTLPIVWAMFSAHAGVTIRRDVRLALSILFAMNSAVNPFVYATRTKFLRVALKELLKDCMFVCRMG